MNAPRSGRKVRRAIRRHGFGWGLARALGAGLMALLVLAALGTGFQRLAAERDSRRFPAPGRLVWVDEHRLHLACIGVGDPTVILEGGLGEWSLQWRAVQARLARVTRVCAYDRAGYGWSPPGPPPRDGHQLAEELHLLLRNSEVVPPYLLVGHGVAGFHLREYAAAHPEWVAGLVLVDAVPPDVVELYDRVLEPVLTRLRQATPAAQFGLLRFTGPPPGIGPRPAEAVFRKQATYPAFYETYVAEAAHLLGSAERADATPLPDALPLLVIANDAPLSPPAKAPAGMARERYNRIWTRQQGALAALSARGTLSTLHAPGANLLVAEPDALADAIEKLILGLRGSGPTPGPGL